LASSSKILAPNHKTNATTVV